MPVAKLQFPDGRIGRFDVPEGTTEDQVMEFAKSLPNDAPSTGEQQPTPEQVEMTDIPSRALRGAVDPFTGLAQMLYNAIPEEARQTGDKMNGWLADNFPSVFSQMPEGGFNQLINQTEDKYQEARIATGQDGFDVARTLGGIVPAVAATLAIPSSATATLPSLVGTSAAAGGAVGASQPVYGAGDYWEEKTKQTAIGAAAGAVAAPITAGIAKVISPAVNKDAQFLMKEGITPTPGGVMGGTAKAVEDRLSSVPIMGDLIRWGQKRSLNEFNKAAYNRALKPIGKNADGLPVGREGISAVKDSLSREYDKLLPKLSFTADDKFLSEIKNIKGMVDTLPDDIIKQYDKIIKNKLLDSMTMTGKMSGVSLKKVEAELGRIGKGYRSSPDFDKRQLGDAINEVQATVRRTLQRANPKHAKKLGNINKGYANYAILRRAASMADTQNGFSPAQLASAVKTLDKSVGKGATATGKAPMQDLSDAGRNVLSSKYPDSGTAGRLMMDVGAVAAGTYNPAIPLGLAAGGLPYTPMLQRISAKLLEMRGPWAKPTADITKRLAPVFGMAAATETEPEPQYSDVEFLGIE